MALAPAGNLGDKDLLSAGCWDSNSSAFIVRVS